MSRNTGTTVFDVPIKTKTRAKIRLCFFAFIIFVCVLSILLLWTDQSNAADRVVQNYITDLLSKLESGYAEVGEVARSAALGLFSSLFLCQFVWAILQHILSQDPSHAHVTNIFVTIARQILTGGFYYWLLFDKSVLKTIVNSFAKMANLGAAGVEGAKITIDSLITSFMQCVWQLNYAMSKHFADLSWVDTLMAIPFVVYYGFSGIVMTWVMMRMIGLVIMLAVEQYITVSLGILLMGFGGADATRGYANNYITVLVKLGFKLFALTATCSIVMRIFYMFCMDTSAALEEDNNQSMFLAVTYLIAMSFIASAITSNVPDLVDAIVSSATMDTKGALSKTRRATTGVANSAKNFAGKIGEKAKGAKNLSVEAVKKLGSAFKK